MKDIQNYIKKYLGEVKMMQLATSVDGQPWACTVAFVHDVDYNLYWLSFPERRHSREIAANPKVAAALAVKTDRPVIGVQAEGRAEVVRDAKTVKSVMEIYTKKHDIGHDFYKNFKDGTNKHQLYKLIPKLFVLFDEVSFPDDNRQEWRL